MHIYIYIYIYILINVDLPLMSGGMHEMNRFYLFGKRKIREEMFMELKYNISHMFFFIFLKYFSSVSYIFLIF